MCVNYTSYFRSNQHNWRGGGLHDHSKKYIITFDNEYTNHISKSEVFRQPHDSSTKEQPS